MKPPQNASSGPLIGVLIGLSADTAWNNWPRHEEFRLGDNPLAFLEHYHVGLAAILADKWIGLSGVGYGFGATLIALELGQNQPFGAGKPIEQVIPNLILGTLLTIAILT